MSSNVQSQLASGKSGEPGAASAETQTSCRSGEPLQTLDHFAIEVRDIAEAVEWYRTRFACEVAYQDDTWALLRFANVKVAFVLPGHHPPHLGFFIPDAGSYGPLTPHRDGTRSVYVQDPSGNAVELLQQP